MVEKDPIYYKDISLGVQLTTATRDLIFTPIFTIESVVMSEFLDAKIGHPMSV